MMMPPVMAPAAIAHSNIKIFRRRCQGASFGKKIFPTKFMIEKLLRLFNFLSLIRHSEFHLWLEFHRLP